MARYSPQELRSAARKALASEIVDAEVHEKMARLQKTAKRIDALEQKRKQLEAERDTLIHDLLLEQVSRLAIAGLSQRSPDRIDAIRKERNTTTRQATGVQG